MHSWNRFGRSVSVSAYDNLRRKFRVFPVLRASRPRLQNRIIMAVNTQHVSPRSTRLRLELDDGSPIQEYSIEHGTVEFRTVDLNRDDDRTAEGWHEVSPGELRYHVERGTVVAQWLERRLGWQRLLQQCVGDTAHVPKAA